MAEDYSGMTVNERLATAGIEDEYYRLYSAGDFDELNRLLETVQLRIDENGMHWSLDSDEGLKPNNAQD